MKSDRPPESWVRNAVLSWGQDLCGTTYPVTLLGVEVEMFDGTRCDALYAHWEPVAPGEWSLRLTVVEVKRGRASIAALIQLLQYMGKLWAMLTATEWVGLCRVHGVIVAIGFTEEVVEACAGLGSHCPLVQLVRLGEDMKLGDPIWEAWAQQTSRADNHPRRGELVRLLDHHMGDRRSWVREGRMPWTEEELRSDG